MEIKDEALSFIDEDDCEAYLDIDKWKLLVVDDDLEVHNVTRMVLEDLCFEKKRIEIISAYSACEAKELIKAHPDTAIILLDVVMEQEDSGLQLIKYIRETMKNFLVRIILRTGQPGQAPEEKIILEYDINDYKEKTELTVQRLYTTIISSLRSYRDLKIMEHSKKGLEKIIEAYASVFETQNIRELALWILNQLKALLSMKKNIPDTNISGFAITKVNEKDFNVIAGIGGFKQCTGKSLNILDHETAIQLINEAYRKKTNIYTNRAMVVYLHNKSEIENLVYMEGINKLDGWDVDLIEIFTANVAVTIDNLYLNNEIIDTQKEIILMLGEIAEARSRETGNHVKRVAEYCKLLAVGYGLSEEDAEVFKLAAPLHDIGKLAIPDNILLKPGKLTDEEFDVIKTHTTIGYEMLRSSQRDILRAAILITLQHHEKYDGTGYPMKLKGEEIHIFGRITALADVFDALGSERIYKKAWKLEDILDYIKKEKGRHFDPHLVDIFFERLDEVLEIRNKFSD